MGAPLIIVLTSGVLLAAYVGLLRLERARGVRYAASARAALDRVSENVLERIGGAHINASMRTFRQTLHFLFHQVLTWVLRLVQRVEVYVHAALRSNKDRAKRVARPKSDNHLSAIADHKRASQLSDEERRRRSEAALNGR